MDLNNIIDTYENYDESSKATSNHARRMEFITTTHILDRLLGDKPLSILDCAAGTGIYSLYLANEKHRVAAVDITKDHIEILNQKLDGKRYDVDTAVNDTRGLDMFEDETFDVVLCMGPLYYLNEKQDRDLCFEECYRVLRAGGLLISSYLNRFFMIPQLLKNDFRLLNREFINSLRGSGTSDYEKPLSFPTGYHCHTPDEIEEMLDTVGRERDEAAPDLPEYIMSEERPHVRVALRRAKDKNLGDDFWQRIADEINRR